MIRNLLVTLNLCFLTTFAFSQRCSSDTLTLYPSGDVVYVGEGFADANSLPCVSGGSYSEIVIPFKTYNQGARRLTLLDSTTVPVTHIYSVRVDNVVGLPSGLCWAVTPSSSSVSGDQVGSIIIKGSTSVPTGTYPLNLTLSVDVQGTGSYTYTNLGPNNYRELLGQAVVKIADASGNCPSSN